MAPMIQDILDNEEKVKKIQRYYNYFRLVTVLLFIGLLAYITLYNS